MERYNLAIDQRRGRWKVGWMPRGHCRQISIHLPDRGHSLSDPPWRPAIVALWRNTLAKEAVILGAALSCSSVSQLAPRWKGQRFLKYIPMAKFKTLVPPVNSSNNGRTTILDGQTLGERINIKIPSCQYKDFHYKDKTVSWPAYLYMGLLCRKRRSLYWYMARAPVFVVIWGLLLYSVDKLILKLYRLVTHIGLNKTTKTAHAFVACETVNIYTSSSFLFKQITPPSEYTPLFWATLYQLIHWSFDLSFDWFVD